MSEHEQLTPEQLADVIAELAADKKAIDVVDARPARRLGYTDSFVVCSGNTDRQAKAIHDGSTGPQERARPAAAPRRGRRARRAGS